MKYKISLCISALCFFTAFLILMASRTTGEEALASRIAPEILRFHVLAESDSTRDQNLKLGVKGLVLDYIHGQVPEDTDKEQLKQWIESNKTSIETMAQDWLADQGASYPVKLELTRDYFPTKAYGDMVFPCGTYDAVRITIGSGKGHNWWCVLYPSLCYTDAIHAVVPDSSKKTLSSLLGEDDYDALLSPLTGQNSRSKSRRSAYGSGSWIYFIKKAEILSFLAVQHILKRLVAHIDPHVLFLRIQPQILGQSAGVVAVIPAAYIPVYLLKGNFP
nr:stage II sporulation protein R [Enterocloster bolteae]